MLLVADQALFSRFVSVVPDDGPGRGAGLVDGLLLGVHCAPQLYGLSVVLWMLPIDVVDLRNILHPKQESIDFP
jgi:hypothetical protein